MSQAATEWKYPCGDRLTRELNNIHNEIWILMYCVYKSAYKSRDESLQLNAAIKDW